MVGFRFFLFLWSLICAQGLWAATPENDPLPGACFVGNVIVHVAAPPLANTYEAYQGHRFEYYTASKAHEKKYTDKKSSKATPGHVQQRYTTKLSPTGHDLSVFLTRAQEECFASEPSPKNLFQNRMRFCFLLNRMESLDKANNLITYQAPGVDPTLFQVRDALWRPVWKKSANGLNPGRIASFEEVRRYYEALKENDPEKAGAFLYWNERAHVRDMVPYNDLRDCLRQSSMNDHFVKEFRQMNPGAPIYAAFLDDDTRAFHENKEGTFSCYQKAIEEFYQANQRFPTFLTSGYRISEEQLHPHQQSLSLAVDLDRKTRKAMAKVFALAPYYPEPNTLILIPLNERRLPEGFHKKDKSSPMEMPTLIKDIVNKRYGGNMDNASNDALFVSRGAIETKVPARFFQTRQGGGANLPQIAILNRWKSEDISPLRAIPQSHLFPNDWSGYVQGYLAGHQRNAISIQGLTVPGDSSKCVKSLLSSVYTFHSPLARFIDLKKSDWSYGDFIGFFYTAMKNYDMILTGKIHYNYGENYKKKNEKQKRALNIVLNQNYVTIPKLKDLFSCIYDDGGGHVGESIIQCARKCGQSEVKVMRAFIQGNHVTHPVRELHFNPITQVPPALPKIDPGTTFQLNPLPQQPQAAPGVFTPPFTNETARVYLKKWRDEKKISLKDMGVQLGYSAKTSTGSSAISQFLRGKTKQSTKLVGELNDFVQQNGLPV